jgi:acetyl esterase
MFRREMCYGRLRRLWAFEKVAEMSVTQTNAPGSRCALPETGEFVAWNVSRSEPKFDINFASQTVRTRPGKRSGLRDRSVGELLQVADLCTPSSTDDEALADLFYARTNRSADPVSFYRREGLVFGSIESPAGFCAEMSQVLLLSLASVRYWCVSKGKRSSAGDSFGVVAWWIAQGPGALCRSVTSLVLCGDSANGTLIIAMGLRNWSVGADFPVHRKCCLIHLVLRVCARGGCSPVRVCSG